MERGDQMRRAVALSYTQDMSAPEIVAKGKGYIAENIIKEALEKEVPVYEDAKLATLLTELQIGEQIPSELYDIVAQILVFVGDLDELYAKTGHTKP
ncbi:MAG: EscU/YscU/HrcU family type III secretion system export apparatus switch protein [Cellulosilyticaceae bacterium]